MTETAVEAPEFVLGARYRVNRRNPEGAVLPVGATVQCSRVGGPGLSSRFQQINQHDQPEGREWIIYRASLDDLPSEEESVATPFVPDTVDRAEHDRIVASLQEQVAEQTRRADGQAAEATRLRRWQESALRDMETLGSIFHSAASDNDLCAVYGKTCDEANSAMAVLALPDREVEMTAEWQETYTVTVTRTGTFQGIPGDDETNQARAESAADNENELEEHELIELLRSNGSHEYDEQVEDSVSYRS